MNTLHTSSTQYLGMDAFQEKLEKEVIPDMTHILAEEIQTYNQNRTKEYA